jgi:CheY-like chemotaxis protein
MDGDDLELDGAQVLVAEDNFLVALHLEAKLTDWGGRVLGPVPSVTAGLALLQRQRPDLALLDGELQDGQALPLAEELASRGVPFLLVTGCQGGQRDHPLLQATPRLVKPWDEQDLARALQQLRRSPLGQGERPPWPCGEVAAEAEPLVHRRARQERAGRAAGASTSHRSPPRDTPRGGRIATLRTACAGFSTARS